MSHFCESNFSDETYLRSLVEAQKRRVEGYQTPVEQLVMWSGAALNWLGDAFTDPAIHWTKEELQVDDLTLTGTHPAWNEILIHRAERSPSKLRTLFLADRHMREVFSTAVWDEMPILVRVDGDNKRRVLDGMHRVIAAVRDGKQTITAWVARRDADASSRPACEPHTVYDLLRAYQIASNKDRDGLIAALRFLRSSYANVDRLLKDRFGPEWLPSEEVQSVIRETISA